MAFEMLCLLEPAVTDGALSKDHDGARRLFLHQKRHMVIPH